MVDMVIDDVQQMDGLSIALVEDVPLDIPRIFI